MKVLPQLTTSRLRLRPLQFSDVPFIANFANNRNISDNTLHIPFPYDEADAEQWIVNTNKGLSENKIYSFAITELERDQFIGAIGLHRDEENDRAEIGYWIAEPYWNRGYASEALAALLDFGFNQLQLNKLFATHLIENPASGRVLVKNGMLKEGELKDHYRKGSEYKSVVQYRLTNAEYQHMHSPH